MKAIKIWLKPIALFLTASLLLQSCVVYHKTPTSLEKASQERIRTKITNTNGQTAKYKYITYEEGVFYGVGLKSGSAIKIPLDQEYISNVVTKNKSASTWLTVGIIGIPVTFFFSGSYPCNYGWCWLGRWSLVIFTSLDGKLASPQDENCRKSTPT